MRAAVPDRLSEMLTRLKLTGIRDQLDGLLDEAGRQELSLRETLVLLCEREIARKDERRIEMTLKLARFPFVRDLSGFDFAAQPSIDPDTGACRCPLDWQRRERVVAGAAWRRQDPSCGGAGSRSDPGRAFGAVRCCHRSRRAARQGPRRRPARGEAHALRQAQALDHR